MKKIKKLMFVFVFVALFAFSAVSYGVEVSVGFSVGAGLPIFRGEYVVDYLKGIDDVLSTIEEDSRNTSRVTLDNRVDVMVTFLPYLALETGVGYKFSYYRTSGVGSQGLIMRTAIAEISRSGIYIPLMLRGQYEYKIGVTYLSAGVKVGFSGMNYHTLKEYSGILGLDNLSQGTIKSSPISLDVAFSLGQEFKVKQSHFLGLRVNYDLNVVAPYAVSERDSEGKLESGTILKGTDWYHDDFTVQFTYRYVFGRKG